MVSSSAPSVYSVQALVLLAEVGFYLLLNKSIHGLSALQALFSTLSNHVDLGTASGHGVSQ